MWRLTLPDFKTVWYWCQDKQIDQWNWIDNPERDTCIYRHLIFDKGAKTTQWGKDMFSLKGTEIILCICTPSPPKKELQLIFFTIKKINLHYFMS